VETKDGLHVWEDHFYPGDHRSGDRREVLPDGELGELVFTTLTKEGAADGALSHPRPDPAPARHGTGDAPDREDHRPQRRHDDPARRQHLPDADRGAAFEMRRPRPAFPDRARARGRMDDMVVHVEAMPHAADAIARAASAKELAHHIKSVVGVSTKIQVGDPDSVERSAGKARRVVDNRPKE
jgi:phenylacetate-CoA ligase